MIYIRVSGLVFTEFDLVATAYLFVYEFSYERIFSQLEVEWIRAQSIFWLPKDTKRQSHTTPKFCCPQKLDWIFDLQFVLNIVFAPCCYQISGWGYALRNILAGLRVDGSHWDAGLRGGEIGLWLLHPDVFCSKVIFFEGQFQNLIGTYFTDFNTSQFVSFQNPHLTCHKLLLLVNLSSFVYDKFLLDLDFERVRIENHHFRSTIVYCWYPFLIRLKWKRNLPYQFETCGHNFDYVCEVRGEDESKLLVWTVGNALYFEIWEVELHRLFRLLILVYRISFWLNWF